MSIIRHASTRQYLRSVLDMNAHKIQEITRASNCFISSGPLRIHSCSNYRSLSVQNGGNQKPQVSLLVQDRALNSHQALHLAAWNYISAARLCTWHHISATHLATCHHISATYHLNWQHISASSYSGNSQLVLPRNISSNWSFRNYFHEESNRRNRTWETIYSNIVKYLSHFLIGVGLSYIIFRLKNHFSGLSDILLVANCSSQDIQINQLESQLTQKVNCSSKKSLQKPKKAKASTGVRGDERISLQAAVERTQKLCRRRKEEVGSPGIVVCVSVDGKQVYSEGFGYSNLENEIPMKPCSVLRIASISKAITATIVAKAWEEGKLDLEKSVHHYVSSFPQKEFSGEKVEITVQQLLSHTSGIRHYKSKNDPVYAFDKPIADLVGLVKNAIWQPFYKSGPLLEKATSKDCKKEEQPEKNGTKKSLELSEMEREEYYLTKHFSTTEESLALFAKDPLLARPGTRYIYSTFAYTLLAAVVEAALISPFTNVVTKTLRQMGLSETYLDLNQPIIYNRAQYYVKDAKGNVVNAPYVDNSYKWAGGGLLSTSEDMVKFGNILLYSAQHRDEDPGPPGFLKSSTIWKFWSPQGKEGAIRTYGLGFQIWPANELFGMCDHKGFGAGHTGAAVGASSALYILPRQSMSGVQDKTNSSNSQGNISKVSEDKSALPVDRNTHLLNSSCETATTDIAKETSCVRENKLCQQKNRSAAGQLPQGVVVCIILNMMSVSAQDIAADIAQTFEKVDFTL